jgi:putative membrane protein
MRPALLTLGLLLLGLLWLGPLPELAPRHFSAHMAMHVGVVAVGAPLLAIAMAGSRFDPTRPRPALFNPIPASVLELVVVWAWHAPVLHHVARSSLSGFVAEQGMFFVTALFVWLSSVGARTDTVRAGAGVVALLLTSMHMTLLGALLALSPRALYAHAVVAGTGRTPLEDQHLGGAIMLLVGGVSYLAGGLWLSARLLHTEPALERKELG